MKYYFNFDKNYKKFLYENITFIYNKNNIYSFKSNLTKVVERVKGYVREGKFVKGHQRGIYKRIGEIKGKSRDRAKLSLLSLSDFFKGISTEILSQDILKDKYKDVKETPKNFKKWDLYVHDEKSGKKILFSTKRTGEPINNKKMGKHSFNKSQYDKYKKLVEDKSVDSYLDFVKEVFSLNEFDGEVNCLGLLDSKGHPNRKMWSHALFLDGFLDKKNIKNISVSKGRVIVENIDGRRLEIKMGENRLEFFEFDNKNRINYSIHFYDDKQVLKNNKNVVTDKDFSKFLNDESLLDNDTMRKTFDEYFNEKVGGREISDVDKVFILSLSMSCKNLEEIYKNDKEIYENLSMLAEVYGLSEDQVTMIKDKIKRLSEDVKDKIKSLEDELRLMVEGREAKLSRNIKYIEGFDLKNIESIDDLKPYLEVLTIFSEISSNLFGNMLLKERFEGINPDLEFSSKALNYLLYKHIKEGNVRDLIDDVLEQFGIDLKNDDLFKPISHLIENLNKSGLLTTLSDEEIGDIVKSIKRVISSRIATEEALSEGGSLFELALGKILKTIGNLVGKETGVSILPNLKIIDGFTKNDVFNDFLNEVKKSFGEEVSQSIYEALFNGYELKKRGYTTFQLKSSSSGTGYFYSKKESFFESLENPIYGGIVKSQLNSLDKKIKDKLLDERGRIDLRKIDKLSDQEVKILFESIGDLIISNILSKVFHGDQPYNDFIGISGLDRNGHVNIIRNLNGKHNILSRNNVDIIYGDPSKAREFLKEFARIYNLFDGPTGEKLAKSIDISREGLVHKESFKSKRISDSIDSMSRIQNPRVEISDDADLSSYQIYIKSTKNENAVSLKPNFK